jgi:YD repeat-containing protein
LKRDFSYVTIRQNSTINFPKKGFKVMSYPYKLSPEEQRLPQAERIVTETIDGKQVQKQIYADGSYGIRDGNAIKRFFPDGKKQTYVSPYGAFILRSESLPDGTERKWNWKGQMEWERRSDGTWISWYYDNNKLFGEKRSDGTEHEWYDNGQMAREKLPDGTERKWDGNGQMVSEESPDGTRSLWTNTGRLIYHATKGVSDTFVYLAKERVEKKMNEQMNKYAKKVEEANNAVQKFARKLDQKIATKAVNSKAFNDIAMLKAKHEVKKSLGK